MFLDARTTSGANEEFGHVVARGWAGKLQVYSRLGRVGTPTPP
jgi:hypothetical protein